MINENHQNDQINDNGKILELVHVEEQSHTYIDKIFDEVKEFNDNYQF